jgi:hypothetical protein
MARMRTARRQACWDMTGGTCFYCRMPLRADDETGPFRAGNLQSLMEIDHQLPLPRGGIDIAPNLVPCCSPCNPQKGQKTPEEFREYLIRIGVEPHFFGSENEPKRDWLCVASTYDSTIAYSGVHNARLRFRRFDPTRNIPV